MVGCDSLAIIVCNWEFLRCVWKSYLQIIFKDKNIFMSAKFNN